VWGGGGVGGGGGGVARAPPAPLVYPHFVKAMGL